VPPGSCLCLLWFMRNRYVWKICRTSIALGERTLIMGILNVTPDSFSDGGSYFTSEKAIARAKELEQQGADILDIGGESTRPGSAPVSEEEELRRVMPVLEDIGRELRIPISIDTYRAGVAKRAIEAGSQIVNDISGLRLDAALAGIVREARGGIVLMHSRGERETLHKQGKMADPVNEVFNGLAGSIAKARQAGIEDSSIVVDPGIGFGKDASASLKVLKSLTEFSKLQFPLLVGTSRKSFIRFITQDVRDSRIWGTAATVAISILNGAHIVRVHDVPEMRIVADVADTLC